ncbi:MAG TPA: cellulase family glycosylhydrolase [Solirubrobacteraceae bacterium]|jgi:hypothetical protein|nr:cellulase family glycosylhydrolase [Solirubrobacteraceae bacterium]
MFRRPRHLSAPTSRLAAVLLVILASLALATAAAFAAPEYRGAQIHSLWSSVSGSEMTEELNALQTAGVNVARIDVGWATMETSPGHEDSTYLAKLDALAAGASARGIKLIATLWQTPSWASSGKAWNDAPSNPATYGAFARFITSRYGSELAAIEVWNEPEVSENLIASNLPATYVGLVKAAFSGARAGDPSIPVLAGAMSYADVLFLRALYANGIKGFYDGISLHPYSDGAAPGDTSVTHSFLGGIEAVHAAQHAAGDDTPEWITEFGWPTGTSRGANTEQQQAEYTERAFALLNGLSYVVGATIYELRDMGTNPADPEDSFGMLRQDFSQTPAFAALQRAMHSTDTSSEQKEPFREGAPETGSGKSEPASGSSGSQPSPDDSQTPTSGAPAPPESAPAPQESAPASASTPPPSSSQSPGPAGGGAAAQKGVIGSSHHGHGHRGALARSASTRHLRLRRQASTRLRGRIRSHRSHRRR